MCIWSTTAPQIRLMNFTSQPTLIFWSNAIAIIPAVIFVLRNHARAAAGFKKYKLPLISVGLFAASNSFTFFESIQLTTIANALITHYTTPVIVAVTAPFFLKEKFTLRVAVSLITAIIGLVIIVYSTGGVMNKEYNHFLGITYGLLSAVGYAAVILIGRNFKTDINPLLYIISQSAVAILIFSPFANMNISVYPAYPVIFYLFTFSVFNIFVAAILFFNALSKVKAATVAIIGYIEPVGAILLSVILFNEPLTWKICLGGGLILFSALIVNMKEK